MALLTPRERRLTDPVLEIRPQLPERVHQLSWIVKVLRAPQPPAGTLVRGQIGDVGPDVLVPVLGIPPRLFSMLSERVVELGADDDRDGDVGDLLLHQRAVNQRPNDLVAKSAHERGPTHLTPFQSGEPGRRETIYPWPCGNQE